MKVVSTSEYDILIKTRFDVHDFAITDIRFCDGNAPVVSESNQIFTLLA